MLELLPRGRDGRLIKSSHRSFEHRAFGFLKNIMGTDVDISILQVDPGTPASIQAAASLTEAANKGRANHGLPPLSQAGFAYEFLVPQAIAGALERFESRGISLSHVDVVIDSGAPLPRGEPEMFRERVARVASEYGLQMSIRWAMEQEEPLLRLPDLLAGIARWRATGEHEKRACRLLTRLEQQRRITVQDGHKYVPPSRDEIDGRIG